MLHCRGEQRYIMIETLTLSNKNDFIQSFYAPFIQQISWNDQKLNIQKRLMDQQFQLEAESNLMFHNNAYSWKHGKYMLFCCWKHTGLVTFCYLGYITRAFFRPPAKSTSIDSNDFAARYKYNQYYCGRIISLQREIFRHAVSMKH